MNIFDWHVTISSSLMLILGLFSTCLATSVHVRIMIQDWLENCLIKFWYYPLSSERIYSLCVFLLLMCVRLYHPVFLALSFFDGAYKKNLSSIHHRFSCIVFIVIKDSPTYTLNVLILTDGYVAWPHVMDLMLNIWFYE